ncbi:MAG: flagellar type III secretion system pore protein FliP [Armatimonadetes bacterium]|nr:flagellar type III secretion system pore protein FliP [Armatimonadota bacterium]
MNPDVASVVERVVSSGVGQSDISGTLRLLGVLTVMSLIPAILILMTSFTRIVIVLSLVRYAIGTPSIPPTSLVVSLALILTTITMGSTFQKAYQNGLEPYLDNKTNLRESVDATLSPFRDFMFRFTGDRELALFAEATGKRSIKHRNEVSTGVLISAFATSELRTAFEMGFMMLLAFLVIDLVVASFLMAMGMMMVPPMTISLPVKILVFVLADGWYRVMKSLITSFQ